MVLVLLADGFEETEVVVPVDLLRRGGVEVALAGVYGMTVTSSHAITVTADLALADVQMDEVTMVLVPGGLKGVDGLLTSEAACGFLRRAAEADKYLAAICAGPTVLSRLGLIDGKRAVCYPGMENLLTPALPQPGNQTVQDGKLLTAEGAGAAFELGLLMLEVLKGKETARQVADSIHYRG